MSFDWSTGALARGLECYRAGEFFEAHEHWEGVWLACAEPDKTFLQALIQVAVAFHHMQRSNQEGTASLLRRALHRLDRFPPEYGGVAVEPLRENIRAWLTVLQQAARSPQIALPQILALQTPTLKTH
jgi:uncharacterized protein